MNRNSNDLDKQSISLKEYGILDTKINYNFSVEKLYKICIENKLGVITDNNVLAINTGKLQEDHQKTDILFPMILLQIKYGGVK